jgi:hypothetical protein
MGTVFAGMGLATLLFPNTVCRLSLKPSFLLTGKNDTKKESKKPIPSNEKPQPPLDIDIWTLPVSGPLKFAMQCFGAQAALQGFLILSTTFTKESYRNFGLAMIPFFVFDYMAWSAGYLTPFGAIGDGVGNVVFTACCYLAYWRL